MKRSAKRSSILSIATLLVCLMSIAPRADAAALSGTATGTWVIPSTQTTFIGNFDGNAYYYQTWKLIYSGDLSGTTTNTGIEVVHPDGSVTGPGTETCGSCTLDGRTGGFTAVFYFDLANNMTSIPFIFTRGFGGLRGLTGGGNGCTPSSSCGGNPNGSSYGSYSLTYDLLPFDFPE
jgi:hypothetical protein